MTPAEYRSLTRPHKRILEQLVVDLQFFLEDVNASVFTIEARVKTFESATAKARTLNVRTEDLYDLAGLRIVAGTEPDVGVLKRFFDTKAAVDDLTIERDWRVEHRDGYRSRHLVLRFPGHYTRSQFSAQVEVQLPTVVEHAFNFLSRKWAYKAEFALSGDWQTRFRKLSTQLSAVDSELAELHRALVEAAADSGGTKLTPFAYQEIAFRVFGERVTLPVAVDSTKLLVDLDVHTCAELEGFFRRSDIEAAWAEFKALADAGSEFAAALLSSRIEFWQYIGLRMHGIEKLLEYAKRGTSDTARGV